MDYRIIWTTIAGGPLAYAAAPDRQAVESLLEQAGPSVSWVGVFDERRRAVAHQVRSCQGLTGLSGVPGWGYVCQACRALCGLSYRLTPPHAGLRLQEVAPGAAYLCRGCGTGMGPEHPADIGPRLWAIRTWPDMTA